MKKKRVLALALTVMMAGSMSMTTLAGQWKQQVTGYHQMGYVYENSDGTYAKNGWQWIDGKCYYFNENGIMLSNTTTPDGYTVDSSGAWTVNGVVQTQATGSTGNAGHSANYDPAHPLAGKIDEWNLRLPTPYYTSQEIANNNIQAMLTGQMDQYFAAPVGEYVDAAGNHIYTTQEDYDNARKYENDLYVWFCNWLNSIDFQNMNEMQRAQEVKKVLLQASYDTSAVSYDEGFRYDYAVLINKKGRCSEFAMTARSLCTALGLKCEITGYGDHSVYYVYVDGKQYMGSNQILNLNQPGGLSR